MAPYSAESEFWCRKRHFFAPERSCWGGMVQKRVQNSTGFGRGGVLVQKKILFYTEKGFPGENGAEKGAEWHRSGAGKVPERGADDLPGGKRKF